MSATKDLGQPVRERRQAVVRIGAAAGQIVEWYDFTIYGFFAVFLAPHFFPSHSDVASLSATFAGFLSTFISRPLGSIVVGHFADRIGRRRVLAITILGASGAATLIGLIPSVATIGLAAPILVVICRLLQGVFAGGEVPAAGSMVIEHSSSKTRAFSTSWVQVGGSGGSILALLTATVLTTVIPHDVLANWGWRIPFLIAAPLGLVGWYIRSRLDETPRFERVKDESAIARVPILALLSSRSHVLQMVRLVGIFLCGSFFAFYIFLTYVPTYLLKHTSLTEHATFLSALIAQFFMMCVIPIFGLLADRLGRKPVLFISQSLFIVLAVPVFLLMGEGAFLWVLLAQLIIVVPIALHQAIQNPIMLELMPTRLRASGGGLAFAIASALFGGTAPLIAITLVGHTGTAIAVAVAVIIAAVISLVATSLTEETGRRPLRDF